jgi:hypothetical protein
MPLLPIQATPHLSSMILIALSTCKPVKRKYADYIALEMLALINRVDPGKTIFNQILFDDASNVLKAGLIIRQHFPRAEVNHGAEHVVALVVEKLVSLPCFREYSKFSKVVCYCVCGMANSYEFYEE